MTSRILRQSLALLTWDMLCYYLKELFTRISKPKKKSEISLSTQKIPSLEILIFHHFVTKNI